MTVREDFYLSRRLSTEGLPPDELVRTCEVLDSEGDGAERVWRVKVEPAFIRRDGSELDVVVVVSRDEFLVRSGDSLTVQAGPGLTFAPVWLADPEDGRRFFVDAEAANSIEDLPDAIEVEPPAVGVDAMVGGAAPERQEDEGSVGLFVFTEPSRLLGQRAVRSGTVGQWVPEGPIVALPDDAGRLGIIVREAVRVGHPPQFRRIDYRIRRDDPVVLVKRGRVVRVVEVRWQAHTSQEEGDDVATVGEGARAWDVADLSELGSVVLSMLGRA